MNTKKFLGIIAVAVLILGFAGQSMAAMTNLELYRVIYTQTGSVEAITDLGSLGGTIATGTNGAITASNRTLASNSVQFLDRTVAGNTTPSTFGLGTNYSNLMVAYFAKDSATSSVWVSGDTTANRRTGFSNFNNGFTLFSPTYSGLTQGGTLTSSDKTAANTYWDIMNIDGNSAGTFNNFSTQTLGEANLGSLANAGYVDQTLYYYTGPWGTTGTKTGVLSATLRTMTDGSTVINPNPVPVPPGILLLAPGLLGLIGLRRRQSKSN